MEHSTLSTTAESPPACAHSNPARKRQTIEVPIAARVFAAGFAALAALTALSRPGSWKNPDEIA
jgi:hypothetical protein